MNSSRVRFLFTWIYIVIYISLFIIFTICTLGLFTKYVWHIACRGWGLGVLKLSGIKLQIFNSEYKDAAGPRILMFNHQSMLDIAWLAATLAPRGVAVVKKEFMYIPFLNLAFYLAGFAFIDRASREHAISRMQLAANKVIKNKATLYIAPEGTRSASGAMLPFKKGGFHLAIMGRLPIYPLIVYGGNVLLPKGSFIPHSGKLLMKFLPPINTNDWREAELDQRIQEVYDMMKGELANLKAQYESELLQ